jgi:hypothetical protein
MEQAIRDVAAGRLERWAEAGEWRVWRDGDAVRVEVFA